MLLIPLGVFGIDDVVDTYDDYTALDVAREVVDQSLYGHLPTTAGLPELVDARDYGTVVVDRTHPLVVGVTDTHAHVFYDGPHADAVDWATA